jgi:DNA-directed RNA polymerase subunit M/transcription elongation factor TFIIS
MVRAVEQRILPQNKSDIDFVGECPGCKKMTLWSKTPGQRFFTYEDAKKGASGFWRLKCPNCKQEVEKQSKMIMLRKKKHSVPRTSKKPDIVGTAIELTKAGVATGMGVAMMGAIGALARKKRRAKAKSKRKKCKCK